MKKSVIISLIVFVTSIVSVAQDFSRGADISWATEMEANGRKFRDANGTETDLFVLTKQLGMNAVRLRVFVNLERFGYGEWCNKTDVVAKARRAKAQGLDILIDFHYSDFFADPGTQTAPIAWNGLNEEEVKMALAQHTTEVLQALKDAGIAPKWVQVGNETNSGIVFPYGKIDWDKTGKDRFSKYAALSNVGYEAVKEIFPDAMVIIHLAGTETAQWFFPDFIAAGGKVDMIGFSHYPTAEEWNSSDESASNSNVNAEKHVKKTIADFGLPVMLCETGFEVTKSALAQEVMIDLFRRMRAIEGCAGIFYWEPETDGVWKPEYYENLGWNAYSKGAFTTDGRPTIALDAFGGKMEVEREYPSSLGIYSTDYTTLLATLLPIAGTSGIYSGRIDITEAWQNFVIYDEDNRIWYGTAPNDKTHISSAADRWNFWIDSEQPRQYDITVDLSTMHWSYTYEASSELILSGGNEPSQYFDLTGRITPTPQKGQLYIVKRGAKAVLQRF